MEVTEWHLDSIGRFYALLELSKRGVAGSGWGECLFLKLCWQGFDIPLAGCCRLGLIVWGSVSINLLSRLEEHAAFFSFLENTRVIFSLLTIAPSC